MDNFNDFADQLDQTKFKALSPGIGLGVQDIQRIPIKDDSKTTMKIGDVTQSDVIMGLPEIRANQDPYRAPSTPSSSLGEEVNGFFTKAFFFLVGHLVDVIVVVLSGVLVLTITNQIAPFQDPLLQTIFNIHWLQIIAVIYGVFFIYLLLFKFLVGMTIGESLFKFASRFKRKKIKQALF